MEIVLHIPWTFNLLVILEMCTEDIFECLPAVALQ